MDTEELSPEEQSELYVALLDTVKPLVRSTFARTALVHEVFVLLHSTRPWPKERTKPLPEHAKEHALVVLKDVVSRGRAPARARRVAEARFSAEEATLRPRGRSHEAETIERGEAEDGRARDARRVAELRRALVGHDLDLEICNLMARGVTKREHIVDETGRSAEEVKTALARIRRIMKNIIAAESGDVDGVTP